MRNNLKVKFHFDRLHCHDEADGWGNAEPYMWTVFFKIDGTTCRLNDSLMLEGTATIFTTHGSHGNLGDSDVDAGDTVPIPSAIGFKEMTLTPIPVPDIVKKLGTDDVPAVAGCIVVLMEEDNVSDDGAEAGHHALNAGVQQALNSLIPTLGFTKQDISDDDIKDLTGKIQSKIENAIKNQQNFFENFWSWINADDTIGTAVFKFSGDQLLEQNPASLHKRWTNDNGDWELFGSVDTLEQPSCPANVVKGIIDAVFGESSSKKSMSAMHDFRNNEFKRFDGLEYWWAIAQRNSHYLKLALNNREVSEAAVSLFQDIPELLSNREKPLSDFHFNCAAKVLKHIATLNEKDRQSRKDINRSIDALNMLQGKSLNDLFESLSKVRPARYPTVKALGSDLKLKIQKRESGR
ncbi:MAG: hypothetical protein J7604_10395 [Sporocytophaga sp.]|uniref:hypothetical protein n=1 Tax=Sporocytophaga sp. TaxID=2231183 RepID=UPI001B2B308D|nr:hypothetical protein [Sporocytophaga sp.]MBO9700608.1 hypothetical protein [Sporocytophaga sp.]